MPQLWALPQDAVYAPMAKSAGWPTDQTPPQPASSPTDSTTMAYTAASAIE